MGNSSALSNAVLWAQSALLGTIASAIAVIAVATMGLLMLSGRIDVRRGARTILGCFLIFGAPTIAAAFMAMVGGATEAPAPPQAESAPLPVLPPAPPRQTSVDPYAGASVPTRR